MVTASLSARAPPRAEVLDEERERLNHRPGALIHRGRQRTGDRDDSGAARPMSPQDRHHAGSEDYSPVIAATSMSRLPLSKDSIARFHELAVAAAASIGSPNVSSGYAAKLASIFNAASAASADRGGRAPSTVDSSKLRRSRLSGVSDGDVADDGSCVASVKSIDSSSPLPQTATGSAADGGVGATTGRDGHVDDGICHTVGNTMPLTVPSGAYDGVDAGGGEAADARSRKHAAAAICGWLACDAAVIESGATPETSHSSASPV